MDAVDKQVRRFEDSRTDHHGIPHDVGILSRFAAVDFKPHTQRNAAGDSVAVREYARGDVPTQPRLFRIDAFISAHLIQRRNKSVSGMC